jgi:hypothetical protein
MSAVDVVEGFRNLVSVEPEAASGRLDTVAEAVKSSEAARVTFVDAVADLIVDLPAAGARYPTQVLADLVADDAMMVRQKACAKVGQLAATLGRSHIRQCQSLFAATAQRLAADDDEFVHEQAGAAWLTLALRHDGIGLPTVAKVLSVLQQTLLSRGAAALERTMDRLQQAKPAVTPTPTIG